MPSVSQRTHAPAPARPLVQALETPELPLASSMSAERDALAGSGPEAGAEASCLDAFQEENETASAGPPGDGPAADAAPPPPEPQAEQEGGEEQGEEVEEEGVVQEAGPAQLPEGEVLAQEPELHLDGALRVAPTLGPPTAMALDLPRPELADSVSQGRAAPEGLRDFFSSIPDLPAHLDAAALGTPPGLAMP